MGIAADPRIDALREKMVVAENPNFTRDYFDPDRRYIGNAMQVFFTDGTRTRRIEVEYPVGHRRRRDEGLPLLVAKFERNVATQFDPAQASLIVKLFADRERLEAAPVRDFMAMLAREANVGQASRLS